MSDTIATENQVEADIKQGRLLYSTKSLAQAVDRSNQYIRNDIRDNLLAAVRSSERGTYLIEVAEAERYAKWLASGRPAS